MKTNTITTIVLVGIVAFSLAACSKSKAPTPEISERTEPSKPPKNQQPTLPSLDQEAVTLAEKAFSETWTQVGDSWFTLRKSRNGNYDNFFSDIIQIRGVTYQVRSQALSEADTLNGLQWKGEVEVFIRLQRDYKLDEPPVRQWSDWKDAPNGKLEVANHYTIYTLAKKNGQWTIDTPYVPDYFKFTKPSEEQIKNILTK